VEDRIRFIQHRGKHVLLIDLGNLSSEELMTMGRLVPSYLATQAKGSVLLLADFTGSKFDRAALEVLKQAAVFDRPHLKKSAWVGAETLPKVFYDNIKAFSQRDLPMFKTREEAMDWLVRDEPAAAAS
jgi:hypothetical protein